MAAGEIRDARRRHARAGSRGDIRSGDGELLPDERYAAWVETKRSMLRAMYVDALRAAGRWKELAAQEPADEPAQRAVMRERLVAAILSRRIGDEEMPENIRWIRSYVLGEADGSLGTVCVYQATSPQAIHRHADRAGLPVDEIVPVGDTVIVRTDPATAAVGHDD